jgi:hypothetical protein
MTKDSTPKRPWWHKPEVTVAAIAAFSGILVALITTNSSSPSRKPVETPPAAPTVGLGNPGKSTAPLDPVVTPEQLLDYMSLLEDRADEIVRQLKAAGERDHAVTLLKLHSQNLQALRKGQLAVSRELHRPIIQLLEKSQSVDLIRNLAFGGREYESPNPAPAGIAYERTPSPYHYPYPPPPSGHLQLTP